jgi:hypothetical protein
VIWSPNALISLLVLTIRERPNLLRALTSN